MRIATTRSTTPMLRQDIHIGPHVIPSDLDQTLGGGDEAPTPHELLAAALVACTAMTVKMYAVRKSWPLEAIEVSVDITKEEAGIAELVRKISLSGPLDSLQRERLVEIANHCPVHKLLISKINIQTTLQ